MMRSTVGSTISLFLLASLVWLFAAGCDASNTEETLLNLSDNYERIGEHEGNTYYVSDSTFTWPEAKDEATDVGEANDGHLVTFNSSSEEEFVVDSEEAPDKFWIGLTDRQAEGEWRWITDEPLTYTNWESGEPNNARDGEDVAAWNNGGWNDTKMEEKKQFVLELER